MFFFGTPKKWCHQGTRVYWQGALKVLNVQYASCHQLSLEAERYLFTALEVVKLLTWSLLILQGTSLSSSGDQSPSFPPGFSDILSRGWLGHLVSSWPGLKSVLPTGPLLVGKGAWFFSVMFSWNKADAIKNFCLVSICLFWSFG